MKKAKRLFALLLAAAVALSFAGLTAFAAPGDGGGGRGGAGGGGGPKRIDNSVAVKAGDVFTYQDIKLTVKNSDATEYTLSKGEVTVDCTGRCENVESGTIQGIFTLTQVTFDESGDVDGIMPPIWSNTRTAILNQDYTFAPTLDLNKAAIKDYDVKTVANASSKTGYTTTFTVDDPDKTYSSVYAYGTWMASRTRTDDGKIGSGESDYDTRLYAPEDWENGMYYAGNGSKAMTYDETSGKWTVSLDLASAIMSVGCFRDVTAEDLTGNIKTSRVEYIPYDAEKQSESFDWTVAFDNEKAGTVTTKVLEGVEFPFADNKGSKTGDVKLAIYTPYGYDENDKTARYPVLYLIAGMQASYDSWFTGGRANRIFDNLIASGKLAPTIVVAMERNTARMDAYDVWEEADDRAKNNGDGDGYINYVEGTEKGSGTENMISSAVVTAVVPYIDSNYNTAADAEHRGVVGVSMGGVAATQIWLTSNDKFNFYGFFSGADMWFKDKADTKAVTYYWNLRNTYTADYTKLLDAAAAAEGKVIVTGGGITDRNAFGGDQNSAGADNVNALLTEKGVEHVYDIVGGAHDWEAWTKLLKLFTDELSAEDSTWKTEKSSALFTDVFESAPYYDAVLWAVENEITNGTSATTFSPDKSCSRAEALTFLWRAAGRPEASSADNPFSDVVEGAYYYDAVLWAAEKGIAKGTGDGRFTVDRPVTDVEAGILISRLKAIMAAPSAEQGQQGGGRGPGGPGGQRIEELTLEEAEAMLKEAEDPATDRDKAKSDYKTLAEIYQKGSDKEGYVKKDLDKALEYYLKAGEFGDSLSYVNAGDIVLQKGDKAKAVEYYEKGSEGGNPKGYRNIGQLYEKDGNYDKALEYYNKALELNDVSSMAYIGKLYEDGRLGQADLEKAAEYYLKAIARKNYGAGGISDALYSLARFYENGLGGLQKDIGTAVDLYTLAADNGKKQAPAELSRIYAGAKEINRGETVAMIYEAMKD